MPRRADAIASFANEMRSSTVWVTYWAAFVRYLDSYVGGADSPFGYAFYLGKPSSRVVIDVRSTRSAAGRRTLAALERAGYECVGTGSAHRPIRAGSDLEEELRRIGLATKDSLLLSWGKPRRTGVFPRRRHAKVRWACVDRLAEVRGWSFRTLAAERRGRLLGVGVSGLATIHVIEDEGRVRREMMVQAMTPDTLPREESRRIARELAALMEPHGYRRDRMFGYPSVLFTRTLTSAAQLRRERTRIERLIVSAR